MFSQITDLLKITLPFIIKIVEATFIPKAKEVIYQNLDEAVNTAIQSLVVLKDKINKEDDQLHKLGFNLGLETLRMIGEKINKAVAILES